MGLYHHTLGFPAKFSPPKGTFPLQYSDHAIRAAVNDKRGDLRAMLPASLNTGFAQLIEVETNLKGRHTKLVYRLETAAPFDLILAIATDITPWRVKTVWTNNQGDGHKTLDKSRYDLAV